jgi:hypothetical protein
MSGFSVYRSALRGLKSLEIKVIPKITTILMVSLTKHRSGNLLILIAKKR